MKKNEMEKLINEICPDKLLADIESSPDYLIIGVMAKLDMLTDSITELNTKLDSIMDNNSYDLVESKVSKWLKSWSQ